MKRDYHRWRSPRLHREMELLVFGHAGARVLVFPTSMGRFFEWEDRGMIDVLRPSIERGDVQVYCVDSVDKESWYADWKHPLDRGERQTQYDLYVCDEVLPLSRMLNPNPFLIAVGASFGAYHAVNFALRHPEVVGRVIGLSGMYHIGGFAAGIVDRDVYFNSPVDYLANENEPNRLAKLRNLSIILAVGAEDRLLDSNLRLSEALWRKEIWHALRVWDGMAHDWPYWAKMLPMYLGGSA
jgi:esterase/lipase superfamily enzyme